MAARVQTQARARLLLVEDDALLRELVAHHLRAAGFEVIGAERASEAWERLPEADAVVLDWMLPDESGIAFLRRLRSRYGHSLPVLMLTARAREAERVEGLESGADDYLVKPFGTAELVARVRSLLRRVARARRVSDGDLTLDLDGGTATLAGAELALTRREFDLLVYLMSHPGKTFSRLELLDAVWGAEFLGGERTVDQHVLQLRSALGQQVVLTVRGRGYRFGSPPPGSAPTGERA